MLIWMVPELIALLLLMGKMTAPATVTLPAPVNTFVKTKASDRLMDKVPLLRMEAVLLMLPVTPLVPMVNVAPLSIVVVPL